MEKLKTIDIANINYPKKSGRMKKTYFQKFFPDKFNFYDPSAASFESIRLSCLSKK